MNKLNLFIILVTSIIFSLLTKVVEGACNYNFTSSKQKKQFCNNSKIGSTKLRQTDFLNKIKNLVGLATKVEKQVLLNETNIKENNNINNKLQAVTDPDKDEDTSDACKKYPEAC